MATRPRKDQILFHTLRRREIGGKGRGIQSATILTRQIYSAITPNETLYNVELPENFVPRRFTPDGKVRYLRKTAFGLSNPNPAASSTIFCHSFWSVSLVKAILFVSIRSGTQQSLWQGQRKTNRRNKEFKTTCSPPLRPVKMTFKANLSLGPLTATFRSNSLVRSSKQHDMRYARSSASSPLIINMYVVKAGPVFCFCQFLFISSVSADDFRFLNSISVLSWRSSPVSL